jgi:hypothetical protein
MGRYTGIVASREANGFTSVHILPEQSEQTPIGRVVRGSSARLSASIMSWGNIVAIVVVPLIMLWCGASMVVYAMNRHHPNPKVGHYTQRAAYLFYGVAGGFTAIAAFIPGDGWQYYVVAWILAMLVIVPLSIVELIRIRRDEWVDIQLEAPDDQTQGGSESSP